MRIAAALLVLLPSIAFAQVRESVTVEVIEVPVYVTGPGGQPVRGLTRDAFDLRVNGRKVPIDYFDAVELPPPSVDAAPASAPPASAEDRVPARERRLYLLFFDGSCVADPGKLERAQRAAEAAVSHGNPASDLFAVATNLPGPQFLTPFLADRAVTLRAVHTLTARPTADPFGMAMPPSERANRPDYVEMGSDKRGAEGSSTMAGGAAFQALLAEQEGHRVDDFLLNMSDMAQRLSGLEGQKHILYFSSGFRASLIHGGKSTVASGPTAAGGLDARRLRFFEEMGRGFAASGVLLDTIDVNGIRLDSDFTTNRQPDTSVVSLSADTFDSLAILASATGGEFVHNRNDLAEAATDLMAAQRVSYILGFNRRNLRGGTISVHVNGVPAGTRLSYRNGFGAAAQKKDLDPLQLIDILVNDNPQHDIALHLSVLGSSAALELHPQEIAPLLPGKGGAVDMILYVFDDRGSAIAGYQKRIPPDAIVRAKASPIVIRKAFDLPPGHYAAKAIARIDGTPLVGFVRTDFTVE